MSTGAPPLGGFSRRTVVIATATLLAASAVATMWQFGAHRGGITPPPVSSATPSPAPSATPSPRPPGDEMLAATHMITAQAGWGRSGDGGVVRTTDGAAHWTTVTPPTTPGGIAATAFIDADHAVVLSVVAAPTAVDPGMGVTYRTSDGGHTWMQGSPFHPLGSIAQLTFIDATHGWVLNHFSSSVNFDSVSVLRSVDGGAHFTEVSRSNTAATPGVLPTDCNKTGLGFHDAWLGWATATCSGGAPFLYATHDGGATWARVWLSDSGGTQMTSCACSVMPPQFTSALHGFLPVTLSQPGAGQFVVALFASDDGGAHWSARPPALLPSPYGVQAIDGTNLYLVGSETPWALWRSSDGGTTWHEASADPRLTGRALDFPTPSLGFACPIDPAAAVLGGPLLRSEDGGRTWHPMATQVIPRGG